MQCILSNASGVHLQHARKVATYSCTFPFRLGLTSRLGTGEEISQNKTKKKLTVRLSLFTAAAETSFKMSHVSSQWLTAILFTILATAVSVDSNTSTLLNGHFETADGSRCTWFELRKSPTKNTFTTACMCKDQKGKTQSYTCQYEGDVQDCQGYQQSPVDFYELMIEHIVRKFGFVYTQKAVSQASNISLKNTAGLWD